MKKREEENKNIISIVRLLIRLRGEFIVSYGSNGIRMRV